MGRVAASVVRVVGRVDGEGWSLREVTVKQALNSEVLLLTPSVAVTVIFWPALTPPSPDTLKDPLPAGVRREELLRQEAVAPSPLPLMSHDRLT